MSIEREETAAAAPKKRRIFRWAMAVVTLLFVCLAGGAFYVSRLLEDKELECLNTELPHGLSAVDTVKQYFEYWDAGNNTGMYQAALPDENQDPVNGESFNAGLCYFCDIKLERAEQADGMAEGFEGCCESAIVTVDFTYHSRYGFGDRTIPESNKGWEFYLAKINENDDFKIISVARTFDG